MIACRGHSINLGEYDRVFKAIRHTVPLQDEFMDSIEVLYREQGFEVAYDKVLQQMEHSGRIGPVRMASRFAWLNKFDIALDKLEIGYEIHDPNMSYITAKGNGFIDSLYGNPRFMALLEKMKLPLPEE